MYRRSIGVALFIVCATVFASAEGDLTVTEIPGIVGWGSISPDGTTVVIAKGENADSLVLYDIESGDESLVLTGRVVKYPRMDPEGERIIFTGEKPYAGLWTVGTDGKGLEPFPSKQGAKAGDYGAMWSPDGSRVVWARDHRLWIANADGSGARILRKSPRETAAPGDTVDGMELGYPIDWIEDAILLKGTTYIDHPYFFVLDVASDTFTFVNGWRDGMEMEAWAQFCDSPDYLMYYHYTGDSKLRRWSVADKEEAKDTARLTMDTRLESIDSFTRSADSSILLINDEDPNSDSYLHMYLVNAGGEE